MWGCVGHVAIRVGILVPLTRGLAPAGGPPTAMVKQSELDNIVAEVRGGRRKRHAGGRPAGRNTAGAPEVRKQEEKVLADKGLLEEAEKKAAEKEPPCCSPSPLHENPPYQKLAFLVLHEPFRPC